MSYAVWMHSRGKVSAIAVFEYRDMAQAYCDDVNRRSLATWCVVRCEESA